MSIAQKQSVYLPKGKRKAYIWIALLVLSICLSQRSQCSSQNRVKKHFQQIDENDDWLIEVEQYKQILKDQDIENGVEQDDEYYWGLVELLYEKYDQDSDKRISYQEWVDFAKDIVDEQVYSGQQEQFIAGEYDRKQLLPSDEEQF